MSFPPISYESFSGSNQALVSSGGPWTVGSGSETDKAQCLSDNGSYCDGYCLACQVFPPDSMPAYHPSFNANISVNLADYGGATTLDFTWAFWPLYCGTNVTAGSPWPINSQVQDAQYSDTFPAVDYYNFFHGGEQWTDASNISHSGSTTVLRGSDASLGYIFLQIAFVMTPLTTSHQEYLNYYVKDISFKITTPLQTAVSSTSSTPSAPSVITSSSGGSTFVVTAPSASASNSMSYSILQSIGPLAPGTSSAVAAPVGSSTPSSTTTPVGVVAGATVGAVAFIALLFFAIFLFRKQRKREDNLVTNISAFGDAENSRSIPPSSSGIDTIPPRWFEGGRLSAGSPPMGTAETNSRQVGRWNGGDSSSNLKQPILNSSAPSASGRAAGLISGTPSPRDRRMDANDVPPNSSPEPDHGTILSSPTSSAMPYDPPPIYGQEELVRTGPVPSSSFSPALALFASRHRDVINENLEARLQAAGYLPTDDPTYLTPEEWKSEYGVTRLELRRLQDLFSRTGGRLDP